MDFCVCGELFYYQLHSMFTTAQTSSHHPISLVLSLHSIAGEAFVTLATTDSYCMGAEVVARSLRRHGTTRSIVAMVTPNISEQSRWVLYSFSLACFYC